MAEENKRKAMIEGGRKLKRVVGQLMVFISPGKSLVEIDRLAFNLIKKTGADVSFNKVPGYKWTTCLSVNEIVVHGVPSNYILKRGDILKLDIGILYKGYNVDYSNTLAVGGIEAIDERTKRFLDVGRKTLNKALARVGYGVHIGLISQIIDKEIHSAGYKVIVELTGHGVGEKLHMEPFIPGILRQKVTNTPVFKQGNAYAIEVIYSMKDAHIAQRNGDGWSLETREKSQSACFENTVFVTKQKGIILV